MSQNESSKSLSQKNNDIMAKALIYEIYPFPAKYYLEDEEIEAHTNSTELPDINEE